MGRKPAEKPIYKPKTAEQYRFARKANEGEDLYASHSSAEAMAWAGYDKAFYTADGLKGEDEVLKQFKSAYTSALVLEGASQ